MSKFKLILSKKINKQLKKMDRHIREVIESWINNNLKDCENPRLKGRTLCGSKAGQWRYRIGDYRLFCEIKDDKLIILAISIAHRSNAYN